MTATLALRRVFDARLRGVRWVEIVGMVCVAMMVLSVYVAKAAAARESARIGELEREIAENRQRVRLLRAEISRLEQPGRLETLSRAAGLAPIDVKRQATEAQLPNLRPIAEPAPPAPGQVVADPAVADPAVATSPPGGPR